MKITTVILALALASIATGCGTKNTAPHFAELPPETVEQNRADAAKRGWTEVRALTLADVEKK